MSNPTLICRRVSCPCGRRCGSGRCGPRLPRRRHPSRPSSRCPVRAPSLSSFLERGRLRRRRRGGSARARRVSWHTPSSGIDTGAAVVSNVLTMIARILIPLLLLGACQAAPHRSDGSRPSFLIVLPDQLRAQALGCMGNPDIRTPHLDALAKEGVLFRNTFANSPVCCPARAVLLTGRYAHANGMVANDLRFRESEVTIAEILRERGYRTGYIGKWHLDGGPRMPGFVPPGPRRQGFDFWAANECSHAHFDTH